MKRRDFLKKAGFGAAAAAAGITGLVACGKEEEKPKEAAAPAVVAKKTYKWKMTSTWPAGLPVLQEGAERIAKRFERMDADADGKVTTGEFAQAGAKLFQRLDENEDGYLSKGELEKRRHGGGKGGPGNGPEGQN